MSDWLKRYSAPLIVLIVILVLWEGLVTLLEIKQFLLPKPTAILSNLGKIIILTPAAEAIDNDQAKAIIRSSRLFTFLPKNAPAELIEDILENEIFQVPLFGYTVAFTRGPNLLPIV